MRKRLEEAMSQANDAEEIIPLVKKVIAQYELMPGDLFDQPHQTPKLAPLKTREDAKYRVTSTRGLPRRQRQHLGGRGGDQRG